MLPDMKDVAAVGRFQEAVPGLALAPATGALHKMMVRISRDPMNRKHENNHILHYDCSDQFAAMWWFWSIKIYACFSCIIVV
jgi:hypothetical protein